MASPPRPIGAARSSHGWRPHRRQSVVGAPPPALSSTTPWSPACSGRPAATEPLLGGLGPRRVGVDESATW